MERSFDEVYDEFGRGGHAFLVRLTGNAWTADELCQETFVRYLANERRLTESNGALGAWLFRVATNLGIDRLRRRRSRPLANEPADRESDTGRMPDARDVDGRIRAEVLRLPVELRATFLLRAHHGLTYGQVADALGISERAAKDRFRRVRERLTHRLAHLLEETDK